MACKSTPHNLVIRVYSLMYNISSNALQGQPAHSPGQAKRHPGLFHVVDGRPAKGKSVDNGRTDNAFALTARRDNATLHPGCRCALPWAMCFCAYSACWPMYFLRKSSQSKSRIVPFWVQQTGHPNYLGCRPSVFCCFS